MRINATGRNRGSHGLDRLPVGVTAELSVNSPAIVQLRTRTDFCVEATIDLVKKAAPDRFKAVLK